VQHCQAGNYTLLWAVFARCGTMLSNDARALLQSMLVCVPKLRATFQDISEHPWLLADTIYTDERLEVMQHCLNCDSDTPAVASHQLLVPSSSASSGARSALCAHSVLWHSKVASLLHDSHSVDAVCICICERL
jgi:hypothetical protein